MHVWNAINIDDKTPCVLERLDFHYCDQCAAFPKKSLFRTCHIKKMKTCCVVSFAV
jgi:hypothetical protein